MIPTDEERIYAIRRMVEFARIRNLSNVVITVEDAESILSIIDERKVPMTRGCE